MDSNQLREKRTATIGQRMVQAPLSPGHLDNRSLITDDTFIETDWDTALDVLRAKQPRRWRMAAMLSRCWPRPSVPTRKTSSSPS